MNVPVVLKKGTPWMPRFEELTRWGGWEDRDTQEEVRRSHERDPEYMRKAGYPVGMTTWLFHDYFNNSSDTCEKDLLFLPPQELYDELFGPQFNEWGEVSP